MPASSHTGHAQRAIILTAATAMRHATDKVCLQLKHAHMKHSAPVHF